MVLEIVAPFFPLNFSAMRLCWDGWMMMSVGKFFSVGVLGRWIFSKLRLRGKFTYGDGIGVVTLRRDFQKASGRWERVHV